MWLVVIGLAIGGAFLTKVGLDRAEMRRERRLVQEVADLAHGCPQTAPSITPERKILVWDMDKQARSSAQARLPKGWGADARSTPMAIVFLLPRRFEQTGRYVISQQPAYRVVREVCVVDWPERRAIGRAQVVSDNPPEVRPVKYTPEYGDSDENIAHLIEGWRTG